MKDIRLDDFVLWFTEKYGPMKKRISDEDFVVYHVAGNKRPFSVILTYQMEKAPFTSITIDPNLTTWNNDVEFAREFHRVFGCPVRCDPGSSAPQISSYSDYFLEINNSKEEYICWGDELIEEEKSKDK